jgi:DNA mismatch endonuclease, patch repair protein
MMAGIRSRDTKPELLVRKALFARGFRYRNNCTDLPGKPDLKLTKYKAVIFVHGCFWHGHACRYYRTPKSNAEFWAGKIDRNRQRDAVDITTLHEAGWRVCVVWECLTRSSAFKNSPSAVLDMLAGWIVGTEPFLELYDHDAMNAVSGARGQGSFTTGCNTDADVFVAERSASYRANGAAVSAPGNPKKARSAWG